MSPILKLIFAVLFLGSAIIALATFGAFVNGFIVWSWLTYFFVIIRYLLGLFNFLIDVPTLLLLVGYGIYILGAYWIFKGVFLVINWVKNY